MLYSICFWKQFLFDVIRRISNKTRKHRSILHTIAKSPAAVSCRNTSDVHIGHDFLTFNYRLNNQFRWLSFGVDDENGDSNRARTRGWKKRLVPVNARNSGHDSRHTKLNLTPNLLNTGHYLCSLFNFGCLWCFTLYGCIRRWYV